MFNDMSRGKKLIIIGLAVFISGLLLAGLSISYYVLSGRDNNYTFQNVTTIVHQNTSFLEEIDDVIPGTNMTIKVLTVPNVIPMNIKITQDYSSNNTSVKIFADENFKGASEFRLNPVSSNNIIVNITNYGKDLVKYSMEAESGIKPPYTIDLGPLPVFGPIIAIYIGFFVIVVGIVALFIDRIRPK